MKKLFSLLAIFLLFGSMTASASYYIVGTIAENGWDPNNATLMINNEITYTLAPGDNQFKVLTTLGSWDNQLNYNDIDWTRTSATCEDETNDHNVIIVLNKTSYVHISIVNGMICVTATPVSNPNSNSNSVITYTATSKVNPNDFAFGANITSHTFADGTGTITFDGEVTSIGVGAFSGCLGLMSVTIPNSVTSIGEVAFANCSSLTSITIPNSVTSIGKNVFISCSGLTTVTIPSSVTSIGEYTFALCSGLRSITIPSSVTSIGERAFSGCSGLTSVTIPESVTSIGVEAFSGCNGLTDVYMEGSIPPSIIRLDGGEPLPIFYNFYNVTIHIPCSTKSAYQSAWWCDWWGCYNFQEPDPDFEVEVSCDSEKGYIYWIMENSCTNHIEFEAKPRHGYHFTHWSDGSTDEHRTIDLTQDTSLVAYFAQTYSGPCGESAYWEYANGTLRITGTGEIYSGEWHLFADSITTLIIPDGITTIGGETFIALPYITTVTIPNSVTSIGEGAFAECTKLRNITCYASEPPMVNQNTFSNYNINLNVLCDFLDEYKFHAVWGSFRYIQCIDAEESATTTTKVTPSTTDATFTWPTTESAATYTLTITKNGEVVCTLTFNANGQLMNIAFAPAHNGSAHASSAEVEETSFQYTVTGLEEGTTYSYTLVAKDANNNTIETYSGSFTTDGEKQGFESTTIDIHTQKFLRNGQVLILRDGNVYNVQGVRVEE